MTDSREVDRQLEEILAEHRQGGGGDPDGPTDKDPARDPLDPFADAAPLSAALGDAADSASETDPYADLPEAPLFALFRTVEREVGIDRIDRIWVFPPRRLQVAETAVVVVTAFLSEPADRRRIFAAHYAVLEDVREPRLVLQELGTAPTDRVGRLVEEAVERLNDAAAAPRSHEIRGDARQWYEVLHRQAEAWLERLGRNPRLRR